MNHPNPSPSFRTIRLHWSAFALAALLVIGIAGSIWTFRRTIGVSGAKTPGRSVRVRDAYADSPFQNARPDVPYVGDAACGGAITRSPSMAYRSHPMGRSLAPSRAAGKDPPPANRRCGTSVQEHKGVAVHDRASRQTRVSQGDATRPGRRVHCRGPGGSPVRASARGRAGISFLIERDGFLFQSPIAWFAQQSRWDLSPGYGEFTTTPNFERAIQPDCLFCHANQFRAVAGTLNHYETPIFQGHAIGCEQHATGPGEHACESRQPVPQSTEPDLTIVNPANLTPALRDSVCEQCHLQGSFRFPRAGRDLFDYRPGLPIHRFLAVFLLREGKGDKVEAVGHAEQMAASRCFRARASVNSLAASRATTRTVCPRRTRKLRTTAYVVSSATKKRGVPPCRWPSG